MSDSMYFTQLIQENLFLGVEILYASKTVNMVKKNSRKYVWSMEINECKYIVHVAHRGRIMRRG